MNRKQKHVERTHLVAILSDGNTIENGPFFDPTQTAAAIARWHAIHGEDLRAVGSTLAVSEGGRLVDFSCSHYTRNEIAEVVETFKRSQTKAADLDKPFEGTVYNSRGRAVRVVVPTK